MTAVRDVATALALTNPKLREMTDTLIEDYNTTEDPVSSGKSLRYRILSGSFWSLSGSVISQGMAFLATLLCARYLGKEGFGELGIVRNTIAIVGVYTGMSLGRTATKYVAEFRQSDPHKANRILQLCMVSGAIIGVVLVGLMIIFSSYVAEHILTAPKITNALIIGSILLLTYTLDGIQRGILAGFEAYKSIAYVNMGVGLATFPLVVIGVRFGGVKGALIGFVISSMLMLLFNNRAVRKQCKIYQLPTNAGNIWTEKRVLIIYSLPALLSNGVVFLGIWTGNALLVNQPGGYAYMGIITATEQIRQMMLFFPMMALQCLLPILSNELNRKGKSGTDNRLYIINSYSAFALTSGLVAIALFFVNTLLALYGKEFHSGRAAMIIMLCSLPSATYRDGFVRLLDARSLVWHNFLCRVIWTVILIAAAVFLVKFGATGLAAAHLSAYTIGTAIMAVFLFSKLDLQRSLRHDIFLVIILSASIIPGVLVNLFAVSFFVKLGLLILTFTLLYTAKCIVMQWFRESSGEITEHAIGVDKIDIL
jgi:O-antigen/teichoic acid export membrane protein